MERLQTLDDYLNRHSADTPSVVMIEVAAAFGDSTCVTPPCKDSIKMSSDVFPADLIIDGIISNTAHAGAVISVAVLHRFVAFCRRDSSDLSTRIGLQILFLISKVVEDELENPKYRTNRSELLNHVVFILPSLKVKVLDRRRTKWIKGLLRQPSVVEAFRRSLGKIFDIDEQWIRGKIDSINIYGITLETELRGACLLDGFCVNWRRLCKSEGRIDSIVRMFSEKLFFPRPARDAADLATLSCHVSVHFFARLLTDDYNFSTPFWGVSNGSPRKYDVDSTISLELGRLMELAMFGNVQPDWRRSSKLAASQFLRRIRSPVPVLPVISPMGDDFLVPRLGISLPAGIDSYSCFE